MSELKQRLQDAIKPALKAGDKNRVTLLRLITAGVKQKEVDERIELDDPQVIAILSKMVKERRDASEQYAQGQRQDLVDKANFEIAILQEFLPQALSDAEIEAKIQQTIQTLGAKGMQDMGKVMGELKSTLQGRADMGKVSAKVKALLS
jgi:uncharacterized protein YqeY